MTGLECRTVRRRDIDGVVYDAPLDLACLACEVGAEADFEGSYYGMPAGWEAYAPRRGYRAGVVCGSCVHGLLDAVLTALRNVPENFTWQPDSPLDEGIGL